MLADDALGPAREHDADPLPDGYWRAFDESGRDPNNELIVVERDGLVVGCLQLTYIPGLTRQGMTRAQIEAVRPDRSVRGRGIGRELKLPPIGRTRDGGCRLVQLTPDKSPLAAPDRQ